MAQATAGSEDPTDRMQLTTDVWTDHDCTFPEVEIEKSDGDENLSAGMKVLTPCPECGETPLDEFERLTREVQEASDALLAHAPRRPLYHWAPTSRRKQIIRFGLRPRMRGTTSSISKAPVVCLGDSPSWAWALSGDMSYTPPGEWDLWQTELASVVEPIVLPSDTRASGIYEIRTQHRIYKRDLWYVASRVKAA